MWFASNLLFLHYQSQLSKDLGQQGDCCDLLRIYYFCTINHSNIRWTVKIDAVVICFEFIIFALSITAFLFLAVRFPRCDLLRIYYFCTINHSIFIPYGEEPYVVICFEFIIFALSITASVINEPERGTLWFASNLLFLHYQSQLDVQDYHHPYSCDLLRIYYFCTINHSNTLNILSTRNVVICFEFIIFALSITADRKQTGS